MDRDCENCVHKVNGACNVWECKFEPKEDEPFEPREDAISRQAVIQHICENKSCYEENCKGVLFNRCMDITWVNELPPVNPQKPKTEWEHDHEILKAYSDGANAVLESLIEQYEHYLELLDADMKDGLATIVTKTKYAVYTEVVEQLKEVLESEGKA